MSKIKVIEKRREDIEQDCKKWASEIDSLFRPELIVFIAKSGYIFAKPLSEFFNIPMVDIIISRPGNNRKDTIKKFIPRLPSWLLFALLRSKFSYTFNENNSDREVELTNRFTELKWSEYRNVLIVDDSTDSGWSLLKAKKCVEEKAVNANIKTLSYCVIDISKKRIDVDFHRFSNTIVITATSRYSKEYPEFINEINNWQDSYDKNER